MTIGCTRCGAQEDGNILSPPIAFAFKHNDGCGHGIGPLAVIPGTKKPDKPKETRSEPEIPTTSEVRAEEVVEENTPKKNKRSKNFSS